jgi:hypothetical protein
MPGKGADGTAPMASAWSLGQSEQGHPPQTGLGRTPGPGCRLVGLAQVGTFAWGSSSQDGSSSQRGSSGR